MNKDDQAAFDKLAARITVLEHASFGPDYQHEPDTDEDVEVVTELDTAEL